MRWLVWRQHRSEALAAAIRTVFLVSVLTITGTTVRHAFITSGAQTCLATPLTARAANCDELIGGFIGGSYQNVVNYIVPWMNLLPVVPGMFLGAPLLAREFEHGTWQLAWTQTVSRRRWLAVKLAAVAAMIVILATIVTMAFTWWRSPADAVEGRFDAFNNEGPMLAAYSLYAFALGTTAGLILRRVVPAMAGTFAGFLLLRLPVEGWLRPRYMHPVTVMFDPVTSPNANRFGEQGHWQLARGFADQAGHHLNATQTASIYQNSARDHLDIPSYLHLHGIQRWYSYQPANRFTPFQTIEALLYITVAATLLVTVIIRIHRGPP